MTRTRWLFLVAICVFPISAWAQDSPRQNPPQNIILVGWDGAQRAHVHECLDRGELPTLKKLSESGALVDIDVVSGATDTKAGWTQIFTGYHPQTTGVYNNRQFRDVPEGLSVFERLKEHFGPKEFVCVAVIGKLNHCGEIREPFKKPLEDAQKEPAKEKKAGKGGGKKAMRQPGAGKQPEGEVVEENGVKYLVFAGSPYYTMHKSCDVWDYGLMEDEKVGTRVLELLDKYKDQPFFFFVHFATVDHKGHQCGENSKEYNDALISNDAWTGKLLEKLKALGLYEKTLVYVAADHGFDEDAKGHKYAPYVFLGTNDKAVNRDGMRQDIAPTILSRFGLDLGTLEPKLDGEALTQPATKPVVKAPEQKPPAAQPEGRKADKGSAPKKKPKAAAKVKRAA